MQARVQKIAVAGVADVRGDAQTLRRRKEILAATVAVIARHGLSNTTIERVAVKAGVSPGLVILYFKRKDLLLVEAVKWVAGEFDEARKTAVARAGGDPERALLALIDVAFDPKVSSPERVAVWYAFWGEANARSVYLDLVGAADQSYEDDIIRLVSELIEKGRYAGLDAEAIAVGFTGLLEWLSQDSLSDGRKFDRRRAVRLARAYLTGIFQRHFR